MANEQPTEAHVPAEPRTEPHREATTDAVPASDIPMAFAADDTPPGASDTAPEPQAASYRIVRKLGEGGMGAVFLAEQQNPRRPVALKVIRSDRVSPRMLQRFRLESQILAWVRHPAVAQVYEAGEMDGPHGRHPYYAMEYVEGETLTRFAARQELDVRGRLELLAEVCDGVEAAHRRGVTHRDLKPANILVTADGRPKILDFGIARVSDPDVPAVQQTDFGQVIGTLNYMSPEQAAGDPAAIDTRADVYSPGVILYELLSDRLPIDVTGKSLPTAVQAIRTVEPPPLAAIDPKFRGDLTAIAGKALAKPPAERYQSAAALAADIRRHLSDQPIEARPPGAWVALRKWARRNKAVAAAAALAAVALVAGTGAASYGLLEAKAKEKLAQEEATKARNATAEERKAKGQAEWELRHRTFINATLLQRQGRYKESLEQYRDAQRFGYEDATGLLLGFADCYGSLGRSKEYDELIRQIAARKDHGKHQAEVWLRLAGAGFTGNPVGGDPDELVRKALKSGLSPAREEFARGMIAPNIAEMERHFAESVRLDPADVEVNGLLFACQLFLGRVPQARQTVARLEMLRPGSVYALVTAVLVALFERNPEELDAAIGRLHALSPARADAYRKLATALQPVLDDDVLFKLRPDTALPVLMPMVGAIQAIAAATDVTHETEPDLAFTAFARLINFPALRWVKELKLPDMLAMLAAAKSGNPGKSDLAERFADAAPSGMTHLLRGMIRGIQGKPLEARAELRKATEVPSLFPVRKPALVLYALDLLPTLARDRGEFIRVLREIVKMGPVPQEEFANLLARAALKVGQPELAALVAADMIARNPDDPRTLAIRATIFLRHGAYGRAHALAEQLLKLKPDDLDGKDIQEMAAEELAKWKAWDGGGAKKAEVPPIPTAKP